MRLQFLMPMHAKRTMRSRLEDTRRCGLINRLKQSTIRRAHEGTSWQVECPVESNAKSSCRSCARRNNNEVIDSVSQGCVGRAARQVEGCGEPSRDPTGVQVALGEKKPKPNKITYHTSNETDALRNVSADRWRIRISLPPTWQVRTIRMLNDGHAHLPYHAKAVVLL